MYFWRNLLKTYCQSFAVPPVQNINFPSFFAPSTNRASLCLSDSWDGATAATCKLETNDAATTGGAPGLTRYVIDTRTLAVRNFGESLPPLIVLASFLSLGLDATRSGRDHE